MRKSLGFVALATLLCCATTSTPSTRAHLPPVPKADAQKPREHVTLAGHVALARGQRALARGEYALAEAELLRAVETLPGEAAARAGLAEVWLMLGLSERRAILLEKAKEAVDGALLLSQHDARIKDIERLISEALPEHKAAPAAN